MKIKFLLILSLTGLTSEAPQLLLRTALQRLKAIQRARLTTIRHSTISTKTESAFFAALNGNDTQLVTYLPLADPTETVDDDNLLHFYARGVEGPWPDLIIPTLIVNIDINAWGHNENTAAHYATTWKNYNILQELLKNGADPTQPDSFGRTVMQKLQKEYFWETLRNHDKSGGPSKIEQLLVLALKKSR